MGWNDNKRTPKMNRKKRQTKKKERIERQKAKASAAKKGK